ncbi:B12-binding domain-containing radical SAM protein [bacterium]|nr:B12-binding domain-containing radical SAM protein [bacterium]
MSTSEPTSTASGQGHSLNVSVPDIVAGDPNRPSYLSPDATHPDGTPAWAPEKGWVQEPKDFHVALIAVYSVENAGIRYLSAALRRAGFKTSVIFLRDWVNNKLEMPSEKDLRLALQVIRERGINLIGIGFMSSLYQIAQALTDRLKLEFPRIPIIWGGIHPTSVPEECQGRFDYLCLGEGEASLIDLCDRLYAGQPSTDIPNIWAQTPQGIIRNPLRPLIADMDTLPYPDTDDENKFYIEGGRVSREEPWKRTAEYRIYFSRGCPYNCSYCYVSILRQVYAEKGRQFYRYRSVEHVLGELEYAKRTFPRLARVKVDDDTSFAFPHAWVEEFCAKYPSRIGLPFECMLIPPMLKENWLRPLKKAGLKRIQAGIESGSETESLKVHNRTPGNRAILAFSKLNKELKLSAVYDVIIDNPAATEAMKLETAEFLLQIERPYDVYFYSLNYFPGTALTRRLLADGSLDPNLVEGKNNKSWKQFRVSMDWPRSPEDSFYLAVYCLTSKSFIPKSWIRSILDHREFWKAHWKPLFYFSWACNFIKMIGVAWRYLRDGELTWFKIRQYGDLRKLISQ